MINAKRLSSLSDYRNPAPLPAQDASPEGSPTLASGLANYPPPSTAGSLLRLVPPPRGGATAARVVLPRPEPPFR